MIIDNNSIYRYNFFICMYNLVEGFIPTFYHLLQTWARTWQTKNEGPNPLSQVANCF